MYIQRTLSDSVRQASATFPAVLICGPRQVGKTTLFKALMEDGRKLISLDDLAIRAQAIENPALFLQRNPPPICIDEIQYAPELLSYIKMHIDQNRTLGAFWLTGSQQFQLMKGVSESLAGRVAVLNLLGLSQSERFGFGPSANPFVPTLGCLESAQSNPKFSNLDQIYGRIWRGSFPELELNGAMDHRTFYASYVQTYVQRDVRDLAQVGDELSFLKFLRVAAARSGQLLNYADMARDADISPVTAKAWISILRTTGLVYLLQPYFQNINKRMVKAPKLYFMDTGLCSYLGEWTSPQSLEAGAMSGHIFETYVVSEILKSFIHAGEEPPVYGYRDRDQKEIDLLIWRDGLLHPVEIKKSANPTSAAIRHFSALEKSGIKIGHGAVICLIQNRLALSETVDAIPVSYI